jgi:hypothetical protein
MQKCSSLIAQRQNELEHKKCIARGGHDRAQLTGGSELGQLGQLLKRRLADLAYNPG